MKGIFNQYGYYFKFFMMILLLVILSACNGISPTDPVINSFTADSTNIEEGEIVTLSWSVTDADTVILNPGNLTIALSGSTSVAPASTTTYTLTATNSAESTMATVTVTVNKEPIEALVNGDFETCDFTGWTVTECKDFPRVFDSMDPSSCIVWMGDGGTGLYNGDTNTASIQQTVNIPLDAVNPKLTFQYQVKGTDSGGEGCDWMKVFINSIEVFYVWEDSGGWQEFQYDLSSYVGTTLVLKISAWTLDSKSSVYYDVDNISITWN